MKEIDRGLAYVCGGQPYGGEFGCGLYFCDEHLYLGLDTPSHQRCWRCSGPEIDDIGPFTPTPDHPDWIKHQQTDPSWEEWRKEQEVSK